MQNQQTTDTSTSRHSTTKKKPNPKEDESDKITEKMEGGILVRRYKKRKIEVRI